MELAHWVRHVVQPHSDSMVVRHGHILVRNRGVIIVVYNRRIHGDRALQPELR